MAAMEDQSTMQELWIVIKNNAGLIQSLFTKQVTSWTTNQKDILQTFWSYVHTLYQRGYKLSEMVQHMRDEFAIDVKNHRYTEKMQQWGRRNLTTDLMRSICALHRYRRERMGKTSQYRHHQKDIRRKMNRHILTHGEPPECSKISTTTSLSWRTIQRMPGWNVDDSAQSISPIDAEGAEAGEADEAGVEWNADDTSMLAGMGTAFGGGLAIELGESTPWQTTRDRAYGDVPDFDGTLGPGEDLFDVLQRDL